ncbi:hypothetical protein BDR26DRAFT_940015 [Obelidium mucronatum]|nr:hypothetical protein BDR26DRAFT_940015 [Obelidium mucronatum]
MAEPNCEIERLTRELEQAKERKRQRDLAEQQTEEESNSLRGMRVKLKTAVTTQTKLALELATAQLEYVESLNTAAEETATKKFKNRSTKVDATAIAADALNHAIESALKAGQTAPDWKTTSAAADSATDKQHKQPIKSKDPPNSLPKLSIRDPADVVRWLLQYKGTFNTVELKESDHRRWLAAGLPLHLQSALTTQLETATKENFITLLLPALLAHASNRAPHAAVDNLLNTIKQSPTTPVLEFNTYFTTIAGAAPHHTQQTLVSMYIAALQQDLQIALAIHAAMPMATLSFITEQAVILDRTLGPIRQQSQQKTYRFRSFEFPKYTDRNNTTTPKAELCDAPHPFGTNINHRRSECKQFPLQNPKSADAATVADTSTATPPPHQPKTTTGPRSPAKHGECADCKTAGKQSYKHDICWDKPENNHLKKQFLEKRARSQQSSITMRYQGVDEDENSHFEGTTAFDYSYCDQNLFF